MFNREAGELLGPVDPTASVGPAHARPEGWSFARLLNFLCPQAWYVDAAGVTQIGRCNALLAPAGAAGAFVGRCRKCHKAYEDVG